MSHFFLGERISRFYLMKASGIRNWMFVKNGFSEWHLILILSLLKLSIHLITYSNFELHRDAYLYYAQSQHLAWGYFSVPPFIAVVGKIGTTIWGNTVFGLRFFPALIGAVNVLIIGRAVKELGGKWIAILLASLAYILSPVYLHTNALFQPVCFNHFFWLLSSLLFLKLINRQDPKFWIWIGITFGLGFLNKYSIVFLYVAFGLAILISVHRRLIWSKYFLLAIVAGFIVILPNLFWQYQNNWLVFRHMDELHRTQLVHVNRTDFLLDQLFMNVQAVLIWVSGVGVLLFYQREKKYRLFGVAFLFLIMLLFLGSGKSYYTLGIYPILFVFGAYFIEKYLKKFRLSLAALLIIFMLVALYGSLSYDGIPFITFEQALKKGAYRWEDGKYHDLPQDMADMTGWQELGEAVGQVFERLEKADQDSCNVFCDNYGQAGSVMFYGKKYGVPQPASLNDSFLFWSTDDFDLKYVIWVHSSISSGIDPATFLPRHFEVVQLQYTIHNPYFRENGSQIYLCKNPTEELKALYKKRLAEERGAIYQGK